MELFQQAHQDWRVLYTEERDPAFLSRRPAPASAYPILPTCPVEFSLRLTLPSLESLMLRNIELSPAAFRPDASRQQRSEADAYRVLMEQLNDLQEIGRPVHQLLGYPDQLPWDLHEARDLQEECADCSDYSVELSDWQLLLQLDSDEAAGIRWENNDLLYFYIPRQALAAREFSQVELLRSTS